MTKNTFIITILFSFFSIHLSAKEIEVAINGKFTNAENRILYLQTFKNDQNIILDSVKLDKKGEFTFKTMVSEINFYSLKLNGSKSNELILLILDNNPVNSKISFNSDANSITSYSIEGSKDCSIIKSYVDMINIYQKKRIEQSTILNSNKTSNDAKVKSKQKIDSLDNNFKDLRNEFINFCIICLSRKA